MTLKELQRRDFFYRILERERDMGADQEETRFRFFTLTVLFWLQSRVFTKEHVLQEKNKLNKQNLM